MASYLDLDDFDERDTAHVADSIEAPDPTHHPQPPPERPRGRGLARSALLGILVGLIAVFLYFRFVHHDEPAQRPTVPPPAPTSSAPSVEDTQAPQPGSSVDAHASTPSAAPTGNGTPVVEHGGPPFVGDGLTAPPPGPDGTVPALATVKAFIPAWTTPGEPAVRLKALTGLTTEQYAKQLSVVRADRLPKVSGEPKAQNAGPGTVLVSVPTSNMGTVNLTVQNVGPGGRWIVTEARTN